MSEGKDNRARETSGRAGPVRGDSPLSRLVAWIAREVAKDLEATAGPTKGGAALPADVDTTTKE
jgi:hypothetical protein